MRVTGILVLAACLALLGASPASGQTVAPPFDDAYSLHDLGAPPGVPRLLGGLTLKQGTTDRLLIGGFANAAGGGLYEIGLTRDAEGHITGFDGTATRFADADNNDGGVAYGPGGTLFLARYPLAQLGQIRPGSTTTDKVIDLAPHGVSGSPGALTFVPAGLPGAGSLKLASYNGGQWYDAEVFADGTGTYDLANVTAIPAPSSPARRASSTSTPARPSSALRASSCRSGRPAACPPTRWTRAAIPWWPRGATS